MEKVFLWDGDFKGNFLSQGNHLCVLFDATSGVESSVSQRGVSNSELLKIYH